MKTFWSFSSLNTYERCPHTQSFPYSARPAQEKNEAAERGIAIHDLCYKYALGQTEEHPDGDFPWEVLRLGIPEEKIGLTDEWGVTDYKTAWFKVIPDNYRVNETELEIIDFKTGKREYNEVKHTQQMQLYATALHAKYPQIETIKTNLWYLDLGIIIPSSSTAKQALARRPRYKIRADKMLSDNVLAPNPSKSNCRFCDFKEICAYAHRD